MKNPIERMSPGAIRILITVAMLVALAVSLFNFVDVIFIKALSNDQCGWIDRKEPGVLITQVVPDGVTGRAGIKDGDVLLKINDVELTNAAHGMNLINAVSPGDSVKYLVQRDASTFETYVVILKVVNYNFLGAFALGICFLVVGYVVAMTRPRGKVQRLAAWAGIWTLVATGYGQVLINQVADPGWKIWLLMSAFVTSRIVSPPMIILFFLYFPVRNKVLDQKWFLPLLFSVSLIVTITSVFLLPQYVFGIVVNLPAIAFVVGSVNFVIHYFKLESPSARRALRPTLIGAGIALIVSAYLVIVTRMNEFLIFTQPVLLLPAFLLMSFPISFGYSIFRYHLMDIDLIVKRSLLYGAITALIAGIYLGVVFGIGSVLGSFLGSSENQALGVIAFLIIAFAFDPIKRRVQDSIDRFFYRERYNYQRALREFSHELPRLMNLDEILSSMVNRISSTMHVEKVAVVLCGEAEGCRSVGKNIPDRLLTFGEEDGGLMGFLRRTQQPFVIASSRQGRDDYTVHDEDRRKLAEAGVMLAVPMFLGDQLVGAILAGEKLSGKVYSQEDTELLETVGNQAAIAIENARLHRSEIEKQKIQEELALARTIQQGLLPKEIPLVEGLDVAGVSLPASVVGGDYFDFLELGKNRLLVVVADVSGKGMSAALYMSKIQGMVQLAAHMYDTPHEILVNVNKRIYEGIERRSFITMILAIFDMDAKEVRICRAGHNKALIGDNGALEYLEAEGMGLGLEPGPLFEENLQEVRRPLRPGGLFFFYTDGLTETMNVEANELGEKAVYEYLLSKRELSARDIERSMITIAEEFRGSAVQNDDLTMVVVKVQKQDHSQNRS